MDNKLPTQFHDSILHCLDCDKDFVFTAGEQLYFESKDLMLPKRCPNCRLKRKQSLVTRSRAGEVDDVR